MLKFWKWLGNLAAKHTTPNIPISQILGATQLKLEQQRSIYDFFSGIDVKVYWTDEDNNEHYLPNVQTVEWNIVDDSKSISLFYIPFGEDNLWLIKDQIKILTVKACNEYGNSMKMIFSDLAFDSLNSRACIEDIVFSNKIVFQALDFKS